MRDGILSYSQNHKIFHSPVSVRRRFAGLVISTFFNVHAVVKSRGCVRLLWTDWVCAVVGHLGVFYRLLQGATSGACSQSLPRYECDPGHPRPILDSGRSWNHLLIRSFLSVIYCIYLYDMFQAIGSKSWMSFVNSNSYHSF